MSRALLTRTNECSRVEFTHGASCLSVCLAGRRGPALPILPSTPIWQMHLHFHHIRSTSLSDIRPLPTPTPTPFGHCCNKVHDMCTSKCKASTVSQKLANFFCQFRLKCGSWQLAAGSWQLHSSALTRSHSESSLTEN
jgi:hypothetical protein